MPGAGADERGSDPLHEVPADWKEMTLMMRDTRDESTPEGPTAEDLAAIDAEWTLIDAELALLDAEIRALYTVGGPSPLDRRRIRRAEDRVLRTAAALALPAHTARVPGLPRAA